MQHTALTLRVMAAAAMIATCPAQAGNLVAEQIFADDFGDALPRDLVTIRVYWQGPGDLDQLVGVVGSPSNPMNITVSGGTFFDSDYFLASSRPPASMPFGCSSPNLPGSEELCYDSWFTIGNTTLDIGPHWPSDAPFVDQVIIAPGTEFDAGGQTKWQGGPGGPENVGWVLPPTLDDPGGGGEVLTPQSVAGNWAGNRVAIMQLTITPDGDPGGVTVQGTMGLLTVVDGVSAESRGTFSFLPAPGVLTALAVAVLVGDRRRRRSRAGT